ncbi:hypothetical protein HGRIS_004207 [Hohenbuehelia grisea]|uniref:F-box domain-containing protein n=1 Tax=Hohenbuehelia grisea TaxID=104357 RepID=A0ABR3JHT2_9AGAR
MHPCFLIEEILQQIISHLSPSVGEVYHEDLSWGFQRARRPPDLASIARMARTCRLFSEPALNELWRDLPDVPPLLYLFPEDLWTTVRVGDGSDHGSDEDDDDEEEDRDYKTTLSSLGAYAKKIGHVSTITRDACVRSSCRSSVLGFGPTSQTRLSTSSVAPNARMDCCRCCPPCIGPAKSRGSSHTFVSFSLPPLSNSMWQPQQAVARCGPS